MKQWEYLTIFVYADVECPAAVEFFDDMVTRVPKFSPITLVPELNLLGEAGWELVHMQPVQRVGRDEDVGFMGGSTTFTWSNAYFCVFKRGRTQGVTREELSDYFMPLGEMTAEELSRMTGVSKNPPRCPPK